MNAQELFEITRRVNDPDEGLRFMSQDNLEASFQIHREVTRRVHNFVAASMTLVEHTRIFMREHYSNTPILNRYQASVDSDLANEPVVNFVKDLRNFLLHNGLPPSEMFLEFQSNPELPDGSGDLTTGIRIRVSELLTWDRWSVSARKFVESSGEFVDVRAFAEAYTRRIESFHDWLQSELNRFHFGDLDELRALQTLMSQFGTPAERSLPSAARLEVAELEQPFSFAYDRAKMLDAAAAALCERTREITLPDHASDRFASERPISATITDQDIVGTPQYWVTDMAGHRVFVFVRKAGREFGFDEQTFAEMENLTEGILQSDWARRATSRSFLNQTILKWLQTKFCGLESGGLSDVIAKASREAVRSLELWAPIANLEVESQFAIGPVVIAPITKAMIDEQEGLALTTAPVHRGDIAHLFDELRKHMQGLAAVVLRADCELEKIKEDGGAVAEIVVGLLRFFSPAATNFQRVCANALLGAEVVPRSHMLILGGGAFFYAQALISPHPPNWRICEKKLAEMRPVLDALGRLVRPEGLSAFALAVRSSLLLFGTGATFSNHAERLTYTLSSVEALLLRHSVEPAEFNVGERMGLLLAEDKDGREEISGNVREAYRLRGCQDISPLTPREINSMTIILRHAYRVINAALSNVDKFRTVADFVIAIVSRKNQHNQL